MRHILAVEGTSFYDMEKKITDFRSKISVSQDIIDWLDNHDIEYAENGSPVYIMNKVRYLYIGPEIHLGAVKENAREIGIDDGQGKIMIQGHQVTKIKGKNWERFKELMKEMAKLTNTPEEMIWVQGFNIDFTDDGQG